jgi:glycosyltransferase involved in cell wall biosynthesis
MKIALVHDGIFCKGGAERVLLNMHNAFPEAPIYTSIFDKKKSYPEFKDCDIRTSWIQSIIKTEKSYKNTFMIFGVLAMQSHDFSKYDVVLCSTTHSGKYIKVNKNTLVINYCYTPFRLAWNPNSYELYSKSIGIKRYILKKIINHLRKIDYKYAQNANMYISMTPETVKRIKDNYNIKNDIKIINPSINIDEYYTSENIGDYYLVVSRLEKYKNVKLAIKAFNILNKPLIIVGSGMQEKKLKKIANNNIQFLGNVSYSDLQGLYSKCKALIFPQHEDYGLTPLEANASGRPVIAYGDGGIKSTMIPYDSEKNNQSFTALFFNKQNKDSLIGAVNTFENLNINSNFIRMNAEKFDDSNFIKRLREFVTKEYSDFKKI